MAKLTRSLEQPLSMRVPSYRMFEPTKPKSRPTPVPRKKSPLTPSLKVTKKGL